MTTPRWVIVAILGFTQALAWASSFYLPGVLANSMAAGLQLSPAWFFAALSFSLCFTAALGPVCGRVIDERGGRGLLAASNVIFAIGLIALSATQGVVSLFAAWVLLGVAMAAGLYEAVFAAITRLYGEEARMPITGVTLIAGFASTVGWPLSAWLDHRWGWRNACLIWAALNLLIALPLNAWALRGSLPVVTTLTQSAIGHAEASFGADKRMWILAIVFSAISTVTTGIATTLPQLLVATGATTTAAIAAAALMGPAQAAVRVIEISLRGRISPLLGARFATLLHPLGSILLAFSGTSASAVFSLLNGAHNGVLTVARGTLPLALFGPRGYGARIGRLAIPARIGQAAAPLLYGVGITHFGVTILLGSSALSLVAFAGLLHPALRISPRRQ